jgi:hypothetical protein
MTQRPDLMAPSRETRPAQRRGMVLAAATLGLGVIQLDVSVVNVAVKPLFEEQPGPKVKSDDDVPHG